MDEINELKKLMATLNNTEVKRFRERLNEVIKVTLLTVIAETIIEKRRKYGEGGKTTKGSNGNW